MTHHSRIVAALLTATLLVAPARRAAAQGAEQERQSPPVAPVAVAAPAHLRSLGVNPLGLPFGLVSAEFEHGLRDGFSAGVGGSLYFPNDENDAREAWVEGKLLYYPNEVALRGFAVGLTAGFVTAHGPPSDVFAYDDGVRRTESAGTVGVLLDYNWLLGRRKRFVVGLGIGAKRALKRVDTEVSPLIPVYPDGRFTMGYAF